MVSCLFCSDKSLKGEDENTIWQARPKDQSLETEMLYRFMVYLGSASTFLSTTIQRI
jgi:hypothetical protein